MSYIVSMIHDIYGIHIEDLSKIGVYCIYHEDKPNRLYIGSTAKTSADRISHNGFYKRFYDHLRSLKKDKHHAKYLQNTVNKYGIEGVKFKILQICDNHTEKDIRSLEQEYLDKLQPVYNTLKTVYPAGRKWTKEEREKQRQKMKGKALPKTAYKKIAVACKQLTKDGALFKEYSTIQEAADATGIDRASISKVMSGKRKIAGGFKWSY